LSSKCGLNPLIIVISTLDFGGASYTTMYIFQRPYSININKNNIAKNATDLRDIGINIPAQKTYKPAI
jgi:hypothetical protein